MAYIKDVIWTQATGFRLLGSTGISFIAREDESRVRIMSDNGFAIKWWYQTGTQIFSGDRVSVTDISALVVNRIGDTATDAGPVSFEIKMYDGKSGATAVTYEKVAERDAEPPVPESFRQVSFQRVFGHDLRLRIGAGSSYQRVDWLSVKIDGATNPVL